MSHEKGFLVVFYPEVTLCGWLYINIKRNFLKRFCFVQIVVTKGVFCLFCSYWCWLLQDGFSLCGQWTQVLAEDWVTLLVWVVLTRGVFIVWTAGPTVDANSGWVTVGMGCSHKGCFHCVGSWTYCQQWTQILAELKTGDSIGMGCSYKGCFHCLGSWTYSGLGFWLKTRWICWCMGCAHKGCFHCVGSWTYSGPKFWLSWRLGDSISMGCSHKECFHCVGSWTYSGPKFWLKAGQLPCLGLCVNENICSANILDAFWMVSTPFSVVLLEGLLDGGGADVCVKGPTKNLLFD